MVQQRIAGIPGTVKEAIAKIDQGARVILFGSKARGESRKDSDWDFLILMKDQTSGVIHDRIREKLYNIELSTGEIITSIIESEQDWRKYRESEFYRNVTHDGVEVI